MIFFFRKKKIAFDVAAACCIGISYEIQLSYLSVILW